MSMLRHLQRWWFPIVSVALLCLIAVLVLNSEFCVRQWKDESKTYTVIIDLDDKAGWETMAKITSDLERKTYQPVYNELIDRERNVYRLKVKVPPKHARSIYHWLRLHPQQVESVRVDGVDPF